VRVGPAPERRRCYVPAMNRGLIGTIIGVLVVIILVIVILRLT
jgi:tetrahydromethanopterin S-methyltransferase subunit F